MTQLLHGLTASGPAKTAPGSSPRRPLLKPVLAIVWSPSSRPLSGGGASLPLARRSLRGPRRAQAGHRRSWRAGGLHRTTIDGKSLSRSDFRGQVVVNVWGSW